MSGRRIELGLRENAAQFSLLVAVNALVGAMVGLERSTLPLIGHADFGLTASVGLLSFLVAFGLAKSVANLGAGALAHRIGRRRLLIIGWAVALPVPVLIVVAPSWGWVVAANLFLGVNQGLTWSMTVVMKIDLAGPSRRGLALGLNEAAGYGGVAVAAAASGFLATQFVARDVLVVGAFAVAALALAITVLFVRDTAEHVSLEHLRHRSGADSPPPRLLEAFRMGTYRDRALRSCSQAGLVNNLNDALIWGLLPLYLAAAGAGTGEIGAVAAIYPATWGLGQIAAGHWSDRAGRKPLIVAGMLVQSGALALLAASGGRFDLAIVAAILLGAGTALVYPTLIAAVSDAVSPLARAPAVGVYRFWRDAGYVVGGVAAGVLAVSLGTSGAIAAVAGLTAASGLWIAMDFPSGIQRPWSRQRLRARLVSPPW